MLYRGFQSCWDTQGVSNVLTYLHGDSKVYTDKWGVSRFWPINRDFLSCWDLRGFQTSWIIYAVLTEIQGVSEMWSVVYGISKVMCFKDVDIYSKFRRCWLIYRVFTGLLGNFESVYWYTRGFMTIEMSKSYFWSVDWVTGRFKSVDCSIGGFISCWGIQVF